MWYKVNKRLIWTKQVRPNIFEYSYDFRNKTWSQCQSDWWTVTWWQTPSVWSDGIYYNWWYSNVAKTLDKDFSNAKKITFSMYYNAPSNFNWLGFRILKMPWDSNRFGTWIGTSAREITLNNTTVKSISKSKPYWWNTQTIEYDLVNKTYSYSWEFSDTWTLTDTQISTIKTLNTVWFGLNYAYVWTVSITVEY